MILRDEVPARTGTGNRATDTLGFSTPRAPNPPPTLGSSNAPSRPSGHACVRTGPTGHRPTPPGSRPHAPGPARSHPGDGPSPLLPSLGGSSGNRAERLGNDRRFPPQGVKDVASYGCPPFRRGGVTWKGDMILTPTTLFSQRAEPLAVVVGDFPKRRIGSGTTRISRVRCDKAKRGWASRVPPSHGATARRTGGVTVVRATPPFWPLVRHGGGQRGTGVGTPLVPLAGGRSHHSDPWREGHRHPPAK